MVKLRLKRIGKRHYPVYKIVAADARSPRDGRFIEALGTYNPNNDPMDVQFKEDRVLYWLNVGAQPTETVRSILRSEGVILKWHLKKKGKGEEDINSALEKFNADRESKSERAKQRKLRRKERKAKSAEKQEETAAPAAKALEVMAPEAKAQEVKAPEANAPEVKTPEVKAPEANAPEVKTPEVEASEDKAPEVEAPEDKAPEVKAPEDKTPEAT